MTATATPEPAPIRARQAASADDVWALFHPDHSGPPRFRLQRESEVPRLVATMTSGESSLDSPECHAQRHRPDQLAGERQERRQIVAIARMVCQATHEVLIGARPVSQLTRWLEPEVHSKVKQRASIMARHHAASTLSPQKMTFDAERTSHPRPGIWEVSIVFTDTHRTRACAMRLQAHRGRWRVVALELA